MAYYNRKSNGAVERDHTIKSLKLERRKILAKMLLYLMFLISAGSTLPIELMM